MSAETRQATLAERAFAPLPLGTIRPAGWLLAQLRVQAAGLSGHLDEFWPDVADSGWIGGDYEGWERGPYWLDGIVPLAFLLDDDRLKAKVTRWIEQIIELQQDDGWLGTARDKLRKGEDGTDLYNTYQYDPWPRSILLKALIQYHEATGDDRVIPAMHRFLHKLKSLLETAWLRAWARYRWADMVLSIHWLYEQTGERWLLDLAGRLQEQGFDWTSHVERFPFRHKVSPIECDLSSHGPNNAMAIKAPAVWYRQSHDPRDRTSVNAIIDALDTFHGQATGMFSCDEHLAGRSPSQGSELCAVVEYMYSLEVLIATLGEVRHADRLEQLAFNALPATISRDMWTHQYDQQVNQIACCVASDPVYTSNGPDANLFGLEPHFGCCTANMHQGWPKFTSHLWMRSPDGGLTAIAYAPCTVDTDVDGHAVRIEVETDYPFTAGIHIRIESQHERPLPIHLRIPAWAQDPRLLINGVATEQPAPGTFHRVLVEGRAAILLKPGLPVRIERRNPGSASLYAGPLLLGLKLEERWEKVAARPTVDDWEVHPTTPWNYGLDLSDVSSMQVEQQSIPPGTSPFASDAAPLSLRVQGRRLPTWTGEHDAAGPVPPGPAGSDEPPEALTLVPYGCTTLRVAEFPVLATS